MKLYPIPGGLWAGTEADWKRQCKARGIDPKTLPGSREVPTDKPGFMEFLNFYAVDVYRTGDQPVGVVGVLPTVDLEALREQHNPNPAAHVSAVGSEEANLSVTSTELQALFAAAPLKLQAELAVGLIDRLTR